MATVVATGGHPRGRPRDELAELVGQRRRPAGLVGRGDVVDVRARISGHRGRDRADRVGEVVVAADDPVAVRVVEEGLRARRVRRRIPHHACRRARARGAHLLVDRYAAAARDRVREVRAVAVGAARESGETALLGRHGGRVGDAAARLALRCACPSRRPPARRRTIRRPAKGATSTPDCTPPDCTSCSRRFRRRGLRDAGLGHRRLVGRRAGQAARDGGVARIVRRRLVAPQRLGRRPSGRNNCGPVAPDDELYG